MALRQNPITKTFKQRKTAAGTRDTTFPVKSVVISTFSTAMICSRLLLHSLSLLRFMRVRAFSPILMVSSMIQPIAPATPWITRSWWLVMVPGRMVHPIGNSRIHGEQLGVGAATCSSSVMLVKSLDNAVLDAGLLSVLTVSRFLPSALIRIKCLSVPSPSASLDAVVWFRSGCCCLLCVDVQ